MTPLTAAKGPRGLVERRIRYAVVPPKRPSSHAGAHPMPRSWFAFVARTASTPAAAGAKVSGPTKMTRKQDDEYGPQFPSASRAWIQTQVDPGGAPRAPDHRRASIFSSKAPSAAVIGSPDPVSPAAGMVERTNSSAPATTLPPRSRSSAVPLNVVGDPAPGGRGSTRTLPAQRTGPEESPEARAIRNMGVRASARRRGVPSSSAATR